MLQQPLTCDFIHAPNLLQAKVNSVYFNHPSQGNSTNYCIIPGPRDKAAPPTSQQTGQFPRKPVKYWHSHPVFFFFIPHPQEGSLCSQPVRDKVRRTGQIFPEHAERSLDPKNIFVAVRWIPRNRFAKQKFTRLRTNYVRRKFLRFEENTRTSLPKQKFD